MKLSHKQSFNKRHGQPLNEPNSKKEISKLSGVPISVLDKVYDRGEGAYETNPQSVRMKATGKKNVKAPMSKKMSKARWAHARVYSFVNRLEGPQKLTHDKDLVKNIPKYKSRDISKL